MSLNRAGEVQNSAAVKTGVAVTAAGNAAKQLVRHLNGQQATRFFLVRFISLTAILFGLGSLALFQFAAPAFRTACYFGMAIPVLASFVSFLVSEWAFEQPNAIFLIVSMGSMIIRMFNLLLAFSIGMLILKMHVVGLIVGLLGTYLSYLIIEIGYIHNKGNLLGQ